jgi:predicted nucleotidyltransferase
MGVTSDVFVSMQLDPRLTSIVSGQPYPLVFATVSGAHLYGFPSLDSDYDLRGVHVLPPRAVMGLDVKDETIQREQIVDGLELDLVTHDARKFFLLLLKKNGYVLEQLLSPLVVRTSAAHAELKALAPACITRYHAYHYLGFAETQWRLFEKESPRRAKPLLYVYRVLLTGIHLMQAGEVQANLVALNDEFELPYVPDLIARKLAGGEHSALDDADVGFHRGEYDRLRAALEAAQAASTLPHAPTARPALNDLLLRLRLGWTSDARPA